MKKTVSALLALLLMLTLGATAYATESDYPKPVVTKQPTGETVDEGGVATFVATADYADEIIWRIVSHDASNTVQAADAPAYFGCQVSGLGTSSLRIANITAAMDGWRVEAMFRGPGGVEFSWGALIRVNGVYVKQPTISAQPQPLSLASGEVGTLTVAAAAIEGELRFQWYQNLSNSNQGGTAIEGATASSYNPEEKTGTVYYYVEVKSVHNGRSSEPVISNCVAVTYAAPVPEEPEESITPATVAPIAPVVDTPDDETPPTPAPTADLNRSAASHERAEKALTMLGIFGGVLAVAALVGAISALVARRRGGSDDDEDDD